MNDEAAIMKFLTPTANTYRARFLLDFVTRDVFIGLNEFLSIHLIFLKTQITKNIKLLNDRNRQKNC
jgi:hypothetical protein